MKPLRNETRPPNIAVLAVLTILALPVAAKAERLPALFEGDNPDRIFQNLVEFPDISGNASVMMLCASQVEGSGKMKDTFCYIRNNADFTYNEAIQKAAKKALLKPATIDGKRQKIYLQFRVEFTKKDEEKHIIVHLNTGDAENLEAYGPDFIAAQRVIGKERWMKVCPLRADFALTARAHVSVEGVGSNVSLAHGYGIVPTGNCQQAIVDTIEQSPFIPAMVDGEAVPSAFVEPFGN
ncbi:MAG: hypothetical protein OEW68_00835 [Gammaproteobacteria bacterium]|nr:hypothetical protein [Gammaproteobacteria bacterium]MDH4313370.1 hypothetical protein [Gammaproteobacteria bacterium]MDH5213717.1 hypothetical protein [Gammaproteobacteria bacterium]MDH5501113.1 hypothetical protein [Gammaproteobacteria bacterium]